MIAIVGLGNIGSNYEKTYHNMGFMVVDELAKKLGLKFNKSKFAGTIAEGMFEQEKVILLKPSTFMNLSGQSVSKMVRMLKLDLSKILVVYDDIDLPVGSIRLRKNGSAGTHNGMRNIIAELGSSEFARLRIGIGRDERLNLADYVLSKVSTENFELLKPAFEKSVNIIEQFIKNKGDVEKVRIN